MKIGTKVYTDDPASRYASVGIIVAKRTDRSFSWRRGLRFERRYIVKLVTRTDKPAPAEGSFAAALINLQRAFSGVDESAEALKDLAIYRARDLFPVVDLPQKGGDSIGDSI